MGGGELGQITAWTATEWKKKGLLTDGEDPSPSQCKQDTVSNSFRHALTVRQQAIIRWMAPSSKLLLAWVWAVPSKNAKAWAVSQLADTSKKTKAWSVSQHADTRKNT